MAFAMAERRAGAYDQQLAQVMVARLSDAPAPWLAAGQVLASRQAEEGNRLAVSSALTNSVISLSIAPIASYLRDQRPKRDVHARPE